MKMVLVNDIVYQYAAQDSSAVGGAERYEWLQIRALATAGWSVTVGVHRELAYAEARSIDGVKFVGIGEGNTLLAWYRFLRSEQPDWWQWQCASHWLGPVTLVAWLSGVRVIFSAMHDRDIYPPQALTRRPRWWLLYAWGLAWADRIFVQHGGQLAQLESHLREKASILPGIVSQVILDNSHPPQEHYVVWVAVLRKPKRPDLLLEIARKVPHIRFVVCGGVSPDAPVEYSNRLVRELGALENIDYLGHVAPKETLKVIRNAALLLSTSDGEGFPSVFLEAWACGTPVISLMIDPDCVIQKKKIGAVTKTVDKTVEVLETLMRDPGAREEMGNRARKHVEEAHSELATIKAFEQGIRMLSV